jgi:predicted metal-dependent hydrolase
MFIAEGIRHFNEGEYFEAHEAWEGVWKNATESQEKHFLQGMIMIAAAFHHHRRKESAGTAKLLRRGLHILAEYNEASLPIDKEDFLRSVTVFYEDFTSGREGSSERGFPKIKGHIEDHGTS